MNKYISYAATNVLAFLDVIGIDRDKIRKPSENIDKDFYKRRIEKGLANYKLVKEHKPDVHSMLEFGTGAHGIDLMLGCMLGIEEVSTVDVNCHINVGWAKHADIFSEYANDIEEGAFRDVNVHRKIDELMSVNNADEFFRTVGAVQYSFNDFCSLTNVNYDLWYSESNLQRIPLHAVRGTCEKAVSGLSETGLSFHRLDLADIYTQPHWPLHAPSLRRFDFLKYGELTWSCINRDSYSSQNRLRLAHWHELLSSLGLNRVVSEEIVYEDDILEVNGASVSQLFQYLPVEELIVSHARILYGKKSESSRRLRYSATPSHW
jgi:hypothetical protein